METNFRLSPLNMLVKELVASYSYPVVGILGYGWKVE